MARDGIAAYMPAMVSTLYSRDILRLASAIPHLGRLETPQGTAERTSPVCGSRVVVDVVVDGAGRVADLRQEVQACALGQASAALMGREAIGRTGEEFATARDAFAAYLTGARGDPGDWPGLEVFSEARRVTARHRSILLAFDAAAAATEAAAALVRVR
ncbi:iron-sulfur cluster assembly scaffold protein [Sphingosinicella sp. LHD-64]|uniref:iron-sulfur cluster assembly scaffold protein n=1 Tax=Sphingosinicella sp. LHD-64 TaxID=3072139 RepID=UPI00280D0A22|nr:iron-sulfur cluster assembly scaffold protein [Sphingosinicella sp. LHD-64]MDQ8754894.1 iron-sulfur cluster assembly scaffold protein [Sphingosinicella sp. LHD-64]